MSKDVIILLAIILVIGLIGLCRMGCAIARDKDASSGKNSHTLEFNGKNYQVSAKRYALIQKALHGDERAQYELITEYYEAFRSKQFIPELCFALTKELADKEKDLGVLTELGDLYYDGVGTPKDEEKGKAIYARALELYDNPSPGLYIPEKSQKYRDFLLERSQLREIKK